ncbi:MAG: NYN domain-containing protein [Patescibacteria group bacterium]|nr:NYN domain-containing protein [Patescibacteria group bacterium]MBU2509257.1 NYN domain-containing protein [Patescibacteria group bacterium]
MLNNAACYAFVDSQNLNLAIRAQGWVLDYGRFRKYLLDKYNISKAFLFIGYVPGNEALYAKLQQEGFIIIFKPTMKLPNGQIKGNVDAELVLHTMIQFPWFDRAIIVSNDGDFYCLVEYLEKHKKLLCIMIPNRHAFSSLLRRFGKQLRFMNDLRQKLSNNNKSPQNNQSGIS